MNHKPTGTPTKSPYVKIVTENERLRKDLKKVGIIIPTLLLSMCLTVPVHMCAYGLLKTTKDKIFYSNYGLLKLMIIIFSYVAIL